ncbi:hypothetical protein ACTFIU_002571 [Dictyostelium citrinum]
MKIEPLLITQLFTIAILIISLISPWQEIKFIIKELGKTTIKDIKHSIYNKPLLFLNSDGSSNNNNNNLSNINSSEYDNEMLILFMVVFVITILTIFIYILITRSIGNKKHTSLPQELIAHTFPIVIIVFVITLAFISTNFAVKICSDQFYYANSTLTPESSSTSIKCFELKISNIELNLLNINETSNNINNNNNNNNNNNTTNIIQPTISSEPIFGYYLLFLSVITSVILSIVHIIRYDSLKKQYTENHFYTKLDAFII